MSDDLDVMTELQRNYADLTQAQKRIAEAIVEDPEFVAFATVDKLAAKLGIASSTIVRFAYRLGLEGYPELQERIRILVRSRLRGAKTPALIVFRDSLPHTPTGKLLRREVLADLLSTRPLATPSGEAGTARECDPAVPTAPSIRCDAAPDVGRRRVRSFPTAGPWS